MEDVQRILRTNIIIDCYEEINVQFFRNFFEVTDLIEEYRIG